MDIRVPFRTPHLQHTVLIELQAQSSRRLCGSKSERLDGSYGKGRFAHVSYANALILLGLFPGSSNSLGTQVSEIRADVACYK